MFRRLTLSGTGGSLVWGYRPIASCARWTMARVAGASWHLTARVESVDARLLTKRPLYFTAPRAGRTGLWCFPVVDVRLDVGGALDATLAPPEY